MSYFLNKRRAIELGHIESWDRRGRGWIHPEDEPIVRFLLEKGLGLAGLLSRGRRNALNLTIESIDFRFSSLPAAFDGFRILQLSDIHGDRIEGLAERVADSIRGLEVDLCVLTGDYRFDTDGPCEAVYPLMETILGAVTARHGVVGILGNHDSIEMVRPLERMGVKMLMNDACEVKHEGESIWVLGVDDPHYYGCDDLTGAMLHVPGDAFKVLLAHSPEIIEEAEANAVHLYLCGHTHGGQICLPGFGPLISNATCPRRCIRGRWRHRDMHGYTSRGIGASCLPVRFNCPPEIGVIGLYCETKRAAETSENARQPATTAPSPPSLPGG